MEPIENADAREPREAKEPMEANEPAEPIDKIEPTEPTDKIDPEEPIDKIEPFDPMLRTEPPSGRDELPPLRITAFWQAPAATQGPHRTGRFQPAVSSQLFRRRPPALSTG